MTPRHDIEFDSWLLHKSHRLFQAIIRLTMGSVYRLFGVSPSAVTLRHAEIYLCATTTLFVLLIGLAQVLVPVGWVVVVLGNIRVLQIVTLNLNTLIFGLSPSQGTANLKNRARWHFVAITFSFFDTILIFGFLYQFFDRRGLILNQHFTTYLDYLYYSAMTITTIGYGDIHPVTLLGRLLVMYEAIIALFFILFFVSGAVARLHRHDD